MREGKLVYHLHITNALVDPTSATAGTFLNQSMLSEAAFFSIGVSKLPRIWSRLSLMRLSHYLFFALLLMTETVQLNARVSFTLFEMCYNNAH